MKILVTGGNSSLGSAMKSSLAEIGEVVTAGRRNCDIYIDLNKKIKTENFPKDIDVMIHAAACSGKDAYTDIEQTFRTNVLGSLNVCEAANSLNVKHVIYISSIFVTLEKGHSHYSAYSLSKRHGEEITELYCYVNDIVFTSIRPSQIYGDLKLLRKSQPFLSSIIDSASEGENVYLYGEDEAKINLIHINDVSKAILLIVKNEVQGVYSCINPENTSYHEFAKCALNEFNRGGDIVYLKNRPSVEDNIFERPRRLYGADLVMEAIWRPEISIEEGVRGLVMEAKG